MEDFKDMFLDREIHFISFSRKSCEKKPFIPLPEASGQGEFIDDYQDN
jgi:hypothetical protein